jgi:hypothetical protein
VVVELEDGKVVEVAPDRLNITLLKQYPQIPDTQSPSVVAGLPALKTFQPTQALVVEPVATQSSAISPPLAVEVAVDTT